MAVSVIHVAQWTVSTCTTRVTYWMVPVLDASQGGQGHIVTQVGLWANWKLFTKDCQLYTWISHIYL